MRPRTDLSPQEIAEARQVYEAICAFAALPDSEDMIDEEMYEKHLPHDFRTSFAIRRHARNDGKYNKDYRQTAIVLAIIVAFVVLASVGIYLCGEDVTHSDKIIVWILSALSVGVAVFMLLVLKLSIRTVGVFGILSAVVTAMMTFEWLFALFNIWECEEAQALPFYWKTIFIGGPLSLLWGAHLVLQILWLYRLSSFISNLITIRPRRHQ